MVEHYFKEELNSPKELKDRIMSHPLSQADVVSILEDPLLDVELLPFTSRKGVLISSPNPGGRFVIGLSTNETREEIGKTLIHEICHIRYTVFGRFYTSFFREELEDLLESETHRFYSENIEFVEEVLLRYHLRT